MSLLIKNANIVPSRAGLSGKTDILTAGDIILEVGQLGRVRADEVIDADALFVSAGFMDILSIADRYGGIFGRAFDSAVRSGTTAAAIGHGGFSIVPLVRPNLKSRLHQSNADWSSFDDFAKTCSARKLESNIAALCGYQSIRDSLFPSGIATPEQIKRVCLILKKALQQGAAGISISLFDKKLQSQEIGEIFNLARDMKCAVFVDLPSHLASSAVYDLKTASRGVPTVYESQSLILDPRMLISFSRAVSETENSYFTCPASSSTVLEIGRLFPNFDQLKASRFAIDKIISAQFSPLDPDDLFIASALHVEQLEGLNLSAAARLFETADWKNMLARLFVETRGRLALIYKSKLTDLLDEILLNPRALPANSAAEFFPPKVRTHFSFRVPSPTFASYAVNSLLGGKLDQSLEKITKIPSSILNLEKVGEVRPKNRADLVIFSAKGIRDVVVSGTIMVRSGAPLDRMPGALLQSSHGK